MRICGAILAIAASALLAVLLALSVMPLDPSGVAIASSHTLAFADDATCSGTAVGPHTILTAAHCTTAPLTQIDGHAVKQAWVLRDKTDHALIGVDMTFAHVANHLGKPHQGEHVVMVGSPAGQPNILVIGVDSGRDSDPTADLYDMRTFFGDSGAGIFSPGGEIVGVQSGVRVWSEQGVTLTLAVGYPLSFTHVQWARID